MNELLEASKKQLTKHLEKGNITENEIALSKILDELSQLQQEKEELINWLMKLVEECDECIIARQILSKLKEGDK